MKDKILKFLGLTLLIIIACLGVGCAGKMLPPEHFTGITRSAGAGETEIILHRPPRAFGGAVGIRVVVNGQERVVLRNGQTVKIIVPNYKHTIYLENSVGRGVLRTDVFVIDAVGTRTVFEVGFTSTGIAFTKHAEYPLSTFNVPELQLSSAQPIGEINVAVRKAGSSLINDLPGDSKIAVVSVTSGNTIVLDELEFLFVSSRRFLIMYRSTPEELRQEKAIKVSGDINDQNLLAVGHMSGSDIVIASSITQSDSSNTFTLRALDVKKGQIIAMARELYF